jgi:TRAP-type C4-dicarboxylate transport system permease small subunit
MRVPTISNVKEIPGSRLEKNRRKVRNMPTKLEKILDVSSTISKWVGCWAALAMVFLITVAVFARYLFHIPLRFDAEYTGYLLVMISLGGAAYALKAGAHVNADLLTRPLPHSIKRWLQLVTDIVSIATIALILYHSWNLAYANLIRGVVANTPMQTPLGVIQMLLPLGWLLFLLQLIVETRKSFRE